MTIYTNPIVTGVPATTQSYAYNFNRSTLPKTAVALAAAASGSTDSVFIWSGDSTTAGAGAGTSGTTNLVGARANAPCTQLASLLTKMGITADNDATFGFQNVDSVSVALNSYDPRFVQGAWVSANGQAFWSFGANMFKSNTTGTPMSITPVNAWDSVDIYSVRNGGNGSCDVAANGTSMGTLNTATGGTLTTVKQTFTAASSIVQPIALNAASAANIYIPGFIFHNSLKKGIKFLQAGMYGRKIHDFTASSTSSWAPQNIISTVTTGSNATTHFIEVTINDINTPTTLSTYLSDFDSYVATSIAAGLEVIIVTGWQSNISTNPSFVNYQAYYSGIQQIAFARNCAFVDMGNKMGTFTTVNGRGEMSDSVHANAIGYADKALYFANLLNSLVVGN